MFKHSLEIQRILENSLECWCKLTRKNFPGILGKPQDFLEKFRVWKNTTETNVH